VGGGTVFGPHPRSYAQAVPRQVRALARRSALNARAREGAIIIVDRLDFEAPKTSRMRELLAALGVDGRKALVLTDGVKPAVFLSARNLPTAHVMPFRDVSTYHVLWSDVVVIESGALGGGLEAADVAEGGDEGTSDEAEGAAHVPAGTREAGARRGTAKRGRKAAAKKAAAKKGATRKASAKKARAQRAPAKRAAKSGARKKTARKSARKRGS
jgi:hypothetical protein